MDQKKYEAMLAQAMAESKKLEKELGGGDFEDDDPEMRALHKALAKQCIRHI